METYRITRRLHVSNGPEGLLAFTLTVVDNIVRDTTLKAANWALGKSWLKVVKPWYVKSLNATIELI